MKTEKNINGKPAIEHKNLFGVHCDKNNFYFFESEVERIDFLNLIEQPLENQLSEKIDLSNIDIDTIPRDQLLKLISKIKELT